MKEEISIAFAICLTATVFWILINIFYSIPVHYSVIVGFLLGSMDAILWKAYREYKY